MHGCTPAPKAELHPNSAIDRLPVDLKADIHHLGSPVSMHQFRQESQSTDMRSARTSCALQLWTEGIDLPKPQPQPGEHPERRHRPDRVPGRARRPGRQRSGSRRARRASDSTAAMKASCPSSTPTLKANSASGISPCGRPTSASAPAKPSPCSRPKLNATSHGYDRATRCGRPRRAPARWPGTRCSARSSPRPAPSEPG